MYNYNNYILFLKSVVKSKFNFYLFLLLIIVVNIDYFFDKKLKN